MLDATRVTALLAVGTFGLGLLFLASEPRLKSIWKEQRLWLALVLVSTIAFRFPLETPFFHGLEYEDAYVYTVVGRQLSDSYRITPGSNPYLTTVCAVGSLEDCESTETFSGHYIGYPVTIALLAGVSGYSRHVGNWISFGAAVLGVLIVLLPLLTGDFVPWSSSGGSSCGGGDPENGVRSEGDPTSAPPSGRP